MPKTLSYADAVRLLGGQSSRVVSALDTLTGGAMLGISVAAPAVLSLFDARVEFIRLSHELVRGLSERRAGLSRYGRTERLAAAHRIIVVTAFFEALAEAELPFRFTDLALTKQEQAAIAGARGDDQPLMWAFFAGGVPMPGPQQPYEQFRSALDGYYRSVSDRLGTFVTGLAAWDRLSHTGRAGFHDALDGLPDRAAERHHELFGRLASDFPEVAFWAALREHEGTRAEVRQLATSFVGLERLLTGISTGTLPDARRAGLARAYAAALDRPIIASGEVPQGLQVPTLGEAYLPPLCRVVEVGPGARPSDESWWADQPVRDDLPEFLTGYLTTPGATRAPLLVLGQPGSGKSVLTRVLAARLPAADFLPVRVVLRDVPAAADLQDQIEYAVRDATGERLDWPALARSAGDALPVVLLDGFDELLQATGVSQTDYLARVATFQRRESDQGRPVVVVVTSRTSVADRAQPPKGTVAIRLEPFDQTRIAGWLDTWNKANQAYFDACGVQPLELPTVLAHRELAAQPLLLLMLALYDVDGNALRSARLLRQDELYERLLRRFARREVTKHRPGLPERELDRAVEEELRRLSVVAFAMFNRNAQWVTEAQLEADLATLFGAPATAATAADLRAPLRPAEIVLGRFFFVHRAQASRDDSRLETYEFLHATFGEFLVARLVWQALADLMAREAAATMSFGGGPVDDDLLHALLSYAVLSNRAPTVGFLTAFATWLDGERRVALTDLLARLFQGAHHSRTSRRYDSYQPRLLPVPARHAAYSANLMLLAVCVAGMLTGGTLYPGRNVVPCWHRETLLWQSQLTGEDWNSLVDILVLDRLWTDDGSRDIALSLIADPEQFDVPPVDPCWTYDMAAPAPGSVDFLRPGQSWENLTRKAYFRCGIDDDVLIHALDPAAALPLGINYFVNAPESSATSVLHEVVAFVMSPLTASTVLDRQRTYLRGAKILNLPWRDTESRQWVVGLLLDRLASDSEISADVAVQVIESAHRRWLGSGQMVERLLRCALVFLGRDRAADSLLGQMSLLCLTHNHSEIDGRLAAEVVVRLAEVRVPVEADGGEGAALPAELATKILVDHPELRARYEQLVRGAEHQALTRNAERVD
ncbi:NACHT domain-containing protein [Micromonospora sp. NPDC003197]